MVTRCVTRPCATHGPVFFHFVTFRIIMEIWDFCLEISFKNHWNFSRLVCGNPVFHNAPFRTEMCTFLFWMEHCGIWNRCILDLWNWSIGDQTMRIYEKPNKNYHSGNFSVCVIIRACCQDSLINQSINLSVNQLMDLSVNHILTLNCEFSRKSQSVSQMVK